MIPKQLVDSINSGRCIAVIGSGPSNAMGYPNWRQLAEVAIGLALATPHPKYTRSFFDRLVAEMKFPKVFKYVEKAIGSADELLLALRGALKASVRTGKAYEYLTRWPFRYYLTTNYDDEISGHLKLIRESFSTVKNSAPELRQLRDDTFSARSQTPRRPEFRRRPRPQ